MRADTLVTGAHHAQIDSPSRDRPIHEFGCTAWPRGSRGHVQLTRAPPRSTCPAVLALSACPFHPRRTSPLHLPSSVAVLFGFSRGFYYQHFAIHPSPKHDNSPHMFIRINIYLSYRMHSRTAHRRHKLCKRNKSNDKHILFNASFIHQTFDFARNGKIISLNGEEKTKVRCVNK